MAAKARFIKMLIKSGAVESRNGKLVTIDKAKADKVKAQYEAIIARTKAKPKTATYKPKGWADNKMQTKAKGTTYKPKGWANQMTTKAKPTTAPKAKAATKAKPTTAPKAKATATKTPTTAPKSKKLTVADYKISKIKKGQYDPNFAKKLKVGDYEVEGPERVFAATYPTMAKAKEAVENAVFKRNNGVRAFNAMKAKAKAKPTVKKKVVSKPIVKTTKAKALENVYSKDKIFKGKNFYFNNGRIFDLESIGGDLMIDQDNTAYYLKYPVKYYALNANKVTEKDFMILDDYKTKLDKSPKNSMYNYVLTELSKKHNLNATALMKMTANRPNFNNNKADFDSKIQSLVSRVGVKLTVAEKKKAYELYIIEKFKTKDIEYFQSEFEVIKRVLDYSKTATTAPRKRAATVKKKVVSKPDFVRKTVNVKATQKQALEDVFKLSKYKKVSKMLGGMTYSKWKDDLNKKVYFDTLGEMQSTIFEKEEYVLFESNESDYTLEYYKLNSYGKDFVNAVNGRLQSLKQIKSGSDLFEVADKISKPKRTRKTTNKRISNK
jgi:hypothetical protein